MDDRGGLVHLEQGEVTAAGDIEQDPSGALDRRFQQGARDRMTGRVDRAPLT